MVVNRLFYSQGQTHILTFHPSNISGLTINLQLTPDRMSLRFILAVELKAGNTLGALDNPPSMGIATRQLGDTLFAYPHLENNQFWGGGIIAKGCDIAFLAEGRL